MCEAGGWQMSGARRVTRPLTQSVAVCRCHQSPVRAVRERSEPAGRGVPATYSCHPTGMASVSETVNVTIDSIDSDGGGNSNQKT